MCLYCNMGMGWERLLEYDEVYQTAMRGRTESTYGFHESYEDLRDQLA
ncbi:hypothetical protein [Halomarina litorea]|nr:hypothetical protein [Halomarina sp. BCD28]